MLTYDQFEIKDLEKGWFLSNWLISLEAFNQNIEQ